MTLPDETIKRTLLIPKVEMDRFKARHGGHGDFTWFVREALRRYNDLNDVDPNELISLAVSDLSLKTES
jgi:hypothetical protein